MRISRVEIFTEAMPLTRPYTIAFRTISDVEMGFVVLHGENGLLGIGPLE